MSTIYFKLAKVYQLQSILFYSSTREQRNQHRCVHHRKYMEQTSTVDFFHVKKRVFLNKLILIRERENETILFCLFFSS